MQDTQSVAHVLRKLDASAWGGTETHVAAITRHLFDERFVSEVHAPTGPVDGPTPLDPRVSVRRFAAFNPFVASRARRRALWATGGNIVSLTEPIALLRAKHIGIAHLHTMGRIGGAVRTAMRLRGLPYIVSVHGPLAAELEFLRSQTNDRLARSVDLGKPFGYLLGARRVVDDAFRVIVFNEAERKALEPRVGDRVIRMDHGVDTGRFESGSRDRAASRWDFVDGSPLVLMVARVAVQKNQLGAVKAFADGAPSHARLVFAGAETDNGYVEAVRKEANARGVLHRVRFLGNVEQAHIPDLLAAADLVLVPSVHEAFGLTVLEAWAARRPVLFSHVAGLVDIAETLRDRSVALPPNDPTAWSAAIRTMMAQPERAARAVEDGRRSLASRFSWPGIVSRLAEIYGLAIASPRQRSWGHS